MSAIVLATNEVISSLTNMILGTQVYSENIASSGSALVDMAKADVGLYGDRKRYISTDALESTAWTKDSEASNLLALNRPAAPKEEVVIIDVMRMIFVTIDDYMTKRAFTEDGGFAAFNSVVLSWLTDTKRVYEATTYNAFIGTKVIAAQEKTVTIPTQVYHYYDGTDADNTDADKEAGARLEAQTIAEAVAAVIDDLEDVRRDYNENGFLRSYDKSDLVIVWNKKFLRKLKKIDLPTIFNNDIFEDWFKYSLPERFFGTVNSSSKSADGSATRSLVEQKISTHHYFPGDLITSGETAPAGTSYQESNKVICKIMHKNSVPYLTSFTANTEFFNPRSLTKNNYLIFGHNTLKTMGSFPFVSIKTS